jgi:hypothetical protein
MTMIFGGYIKDALTGRQQLKLVTNPETAILDDYISLYGQSDGVLSINVDPAPDVGAYELVLYAESQQYLLMLNEIADDGDNNVRTLSLLGEDNLLANMLGEPYPNRAVTDNLNIARRAFLEFASTEKVSTDLLS